MTILNINLYSIYIYWNVCGHILINKQFSFNREPVLRCKCYSLLVQFTLLSQCQFDFLSFTIRLWQSGSSLGRCSWCDPVSNGVKTEKHRAVVRNNIIFYFQQITSTSVKSTWQCQIEAAGAELMEKKSYNSDNQLPWLAVHSWITW